MQKIFIITVCFLFLFIFCGNSPETIGISMSQTISQIPNSAVDICPILIGTTVPKLILTTVDEKPFDLNTAITKKPTILIFYRGGWCPYCNVHLGQLQEIESQLIKLGYQIIALSTDRPEKLRESIQKHNLKYLLLSDSKMIAARIFRIAFKVDDKTIAQYKKYGINLEDASGEKHHFLPVPAVFIIGTDGVIKFEYVNPNYKVRIDPDVLLAAAKSALK